MMEPTTATEFASTQRKDIRTKKEFWLQHFQQFQGSDLTKAAYARKNDLIPSQFIYWCHKFEKESQSVQSSSEESSDFVAVRMGRNTLPLKGEILCTLDFGNHKQLLIHTELALHSKSTIPAEVFLAGIIALGCKLVFLRWHKYLLELSKYPDEYSELVFYIILLICELMA
jgi:hypothetical protein